MHIDHRAVSEVIPPFPLGITPFSTVKSSDFSQTDQFVVKLINKLGESNAFGLMRSLPKSIQEAELL